MKHLLYTAMAALLVSSSLQVVLAHTPLAQLLKHEAMLNIAYNDCIEAGVKRGFGVPSVLHNRAEWPKGYRDCAIIMRLHYLKAWEYWYAKHAAQRVQIRQAAAMLRAPHGVKQ